ncbi:hypothetical protein HYDPIDRAFT_104395, partial [Hydnomerulius pinastri MD-312]
MPVLHRPLTNAKFTLDASGVAGFFGGEEAISAMATVHLYRGRRWTGWYNSPGSYTIAKRFGQIANSRFWDGLFPGPNDPPETSFGLDGREGPKYVAALSGTEMQTGHLGYLTLERSREVEKVVIDGRKTATGDVTLLVVPEVRYDGEVTRQGLKSALLAFFPIITSVVTCIMCAVVADWFCFSMILLGIISSGVASLVMGSGKLFLETVTKPAPGAPLGDGMLMPATENNVVVNRIGMCSLLLVVQFLLQLLLIPQGTLFGQLMFVASLGVSWAYNSYLSSLEKEKIQGENFFKTLGDLRMHKFQLGTRTSMSVFACLLLCEGHERPFKNISPTKILQQFIRNDTSVWQRWREKVILQMNNGGQSLSFLEMDQDELTHFSESDTKLLKTLLADAKAAFEGYFLHESDL